MYKKCLVTEVNDAANVWLWILHCQAAVML